ncbi:MAG: hypothetical protein BJ554DRAFT_4835 [Olpidium bornovanus]|uniref:Uncharacterized protein n=1 Tax=Olpidium bornovanus TaxID=278681 RepID=A0A8H7ZL76_9FUNG|nr:MAG: hypothetical protein BJ554DRAFT_4835 [Olpidium bornovanus]
MADRKGKRGKPEREARRDPRSARPGAVPGAFRSLAESPDGRQRIPSVPDVARPLPQRAFDTFAPAATNKYYPPGWDPSKGSINKYVGQHPLRDRARKLDQGILIVRFELPFNIWCDGCGKSIGKGTHLLIPCFSPAIPTGRSVRFNAEKKKIGNYYSTAILSFRMKCHGCLEWIEVHTDPKNAEYVVVAGARRKKEDFEPEDNETIRLTSEEEKARMAEDPFYVLEKRGEDERKAKEDIPKLTMLQVRKRRVVVS